MTCVEWRPHPIGGGSLCWTLGYRGRNTPVQPQDSPVWAFFPRCGCKHGKVHHRRGLREPGQARCPKLWSRGLWVLAFLCWLPGSGGVRPQTLLTSALCPLTGAQHCPRSFGCCDSVTCHAWCPCHSGVLVLVWPLWLGLRSQVGDPMGLCPSKRRHWEYTPGGRPQEKSSCPRPSLWPPVPGWRKALSHAAPCGAVALQVDPVGLLSPPAQAQGEALSWLQPMR